MNKKHVEIGASLGIVYDDKIWHMNGNIVITNVIYHGQDGKGRYVYSGLRTTTGRSTGEKPYVFIVIPENWSLLADSLWDSNGTHNPRTLEEARDKADYAVSVKKDMYWSDPKPEHNYNFVGKLNTAHVYTVE